MHCDIDKNTWVPVQISINRGSHPRYERMKEFLEIQNFLQDKLFKQRNSQVSFIYAWSVERIKLYWIKPKHSTRVRFKFNQTRLFVKSHLFGEINLVLGIDCMEFV
jgi:hypothetical protein